MKVIYIHDFLSQIAYDAVFGGISPLVVYIRQDAAAPHLKAILTIALNTGMRRNEILGLKWKNINFAKGYIHIENSKSGKSRRVPMNSLALDTFRNTDKTKKYVFYNSYTKRCLKNISTSFKSACDKAEIKDLRLHDLRHTCATRMIEAGVDLVTVSKILGHSSIQMTIRYAHPTPENMQRVVDKLADIFDRNEQKCDYNTILNQYRPFTSPPPSA